MYTLDLLYLSLSFIIIISIYAHNFQTSALPPGLCFHLADLLGPKILRGQLRGFPTSDRGATKAGGNQQNCFKEPTKLLEHIEKPGMFIKHHQTYI